MKKNEKITYEKAVEICDKYFGRERLTPQQEKLLSEACNFIEKEEEDLNFEMSESSPLEILIFLLEEGGNIEKSLNTLGEDLTKIVGERKTALKILNGRVTVEQSGFSRQIASHFKVDPNLFSDILYSMRNTARGLYKAKALSFKELLKVLKM